MLLLALACSKPEPAPAEMEDLAAFFFREWPSEDPTRMQEAMARLEACADVTDLAAENPDDRAFIVGPFTRAEVDGLVDHDRDPAETFGVGLLYRSPFSIPDHLHVISQTDQSPTEPTSPDHFVRTWIDGDPDCLADGTCETMQSHNDVERDTALYDIGYEIIKEWRFVDDGLAARSWNIDEAQSHSGTIKILQGYALDVFVPDGDGTIRLHLSWQETDIPGLDDSDMAGGMANGIQDLLETQDAWLEDNAP
ncbi:MAG: hypothetical protein GY913_19495 [Proteobacteria bacterium]|nr:hypothetical protein [Pseudomonadota bacterium]MCP4919096.1 hypothetical protein [Pseudomonadota bacterium]